MFKIQILRASTKFKDWSREKRKKLKQEKVVFPFNSLPPISHNEAKLLSHKNHEKDLVSEETEVLVSKETKVPFLW